jgi:hypothetical protein
MSDTARGIDQRPQMGRGRLVGIGIDLPAPVTRRGLDRVKVSGALTDQAALTSA